jgi:hypothetical protein
MDGNGGDAGVEDEVVHVDGTNILAIVHVDEGGIALDLSLETGFFCENKNKEKNMVKGNVRYGW